MKLWVALSAIAILGGSCAVSAQDVDESSSSDITLMVQVFRTVGSQTTVQQFMITLSDFSSILRKLSRILENQPSSDLTDGLSSLTTTLQRLISRIESDTSDQDAVSNFSKNLLLLLNTLNASNDPDLKDILQLIESSFASNVDSEAAQPAIPQSSRTRTATSSKKSKAPQTSRRRVAPVTEASNVVVVNINMTTNSQVDNLINTLTTLLDYTSDPSIIELLNQLIEQLRSFSQSNDFSTLIDILRTSLPLFTQDGSEINLSGTASSIVSTLIASLNPSDGLSQLLAFLMGLVEVGSLSTADADDTLNLLRLDGRGNLLKALLAVLQTLSSRIPSSVSAPYKTLQQQLRTLATNQNSAAVTNALSALRNFVKSVISYNGSDRSSLIGIARLIINVLMSYLRRNPSAITTLRSLMSNLDSAPIVAATEIPTVRAASRTVRPSGTRQVGHRCGGILSHLVCFVSNVLVGPKGDSGVIGSMNGMFGGSLGGNSWGLGGNVGSGRIWGSDGGWGSEGGLVPTVTPTRNRWSDDGWGIPGMFRRFVNAIF